MNTTQITWTTTDLSMDYIRSRFGAKHIASIVDGETNEDAARVCESKAVGYWTANEPEHYAMYRSLAAHLRAGTVA